MIAWRRWPGWLLWLSLAALAAWRYSGQATDDVYITYRYADNLAHGRGLVFNPGERVYGVSDPGVAILLAACNRATGLPIPALGTALTALALLAVAGSLLPAAGRKPEAWLAGTLLLTSVYAWLSQGAGPLPALALLLLAARRADALYPWQAGLLAGLAFACRPDAALGAACLAGLVFVEMPVAPPDGPVPARRRFAVRCLRLAIFGAAAAVVVALVLLAAWRYFGSALPETFAVKRRYAALKPGDFVGGAFWRAARESFCSLAGPGGLALLILGILGQPALCRRGGRAARLLVLYSLILAAFYTAAAVPFFLWYTVPCVVAVLYGACFLAGDLARRGGLSGLGRRGGLSGFGRLGAAEPAQDCASAGSAAAVAGEDGGRHAVAELGGSGRAGDRGGAEGSGQAAEGGGAAAPLQAGWRLLFLAAAALAAVVVGSALWTGGRWWSAGGSSDWRLVAYRGAGEWLRAHTPPTADVAFDEIGIVGYYSDRPIRDLIGLVSPLSRPYAAVGDPLGAFLAGPPEVLLFQTHDHRGGTRPIRDRPWFAAAYPRVAVVGDAADRTEILIYRRRPGAALPPRRQPLAHTQPPP